MRFFLFTDLLCATILSTKAMTATGFIMGFYPRKEVVP